MYGRYLQNGNILAARAFISHLVSQFAVSRPNFVSSIQPSPIPIGKAESGTTDEIVFTTDSLVNFAQLAVRACQRSQGDKNKVMREAWIRLCGSYQSRGGLLAVKEVRQVRPSKGHPFHILSFSRWLASCVRVARAGHARPGLGRSKITTSSQL